MFDLSDLQGKDREIAKAICDEAKKTLKEELTLAISELQALENEIATDDDFRIKAPGEYSYSQQFVIFPIVKNLHSELKNLQSELNCHG